MSHPNLPTAAAPTLSAPAAATPPLVIAGHGTRVAAGAAQAPDAVKLASGTEKPSLFSRHSRGPDSPNAPPAPRLTASTSTRPSLLPRNSKSSTTMSSAGIEAGC